MQRPGASSNLLHLFSASLLKHILYESNTFIRIEKEVSTWINRCFGTFVLPLVPFERLARPAGPPQEEKTWKQWKM